MSFNNPKVSIAMCTYNGSKFIAEQLESIINQTYRNLEILVVDDGSIDETVTICHSFQDCRIKIWTNERNLGYTKNFEKAISLCSGEYICLCDQDDVWDLKKVETLVDEIGQNILIYHDSDFIDENGGHLKEPSMAERYHMYDGKSSLPFLLFNCISGHASMFSRELVKYLLPFDGRFFHDWWLAYVASNLGQIKFLNLILVHYRQHTSSITDNLGLKLERNKGKRVKIDINWIQTCMLFRFNKNQSLITEAHYIFKNLLENKLRWKAFLFIVKYYDELFFIANRKPKSFASKFNFARKISLSAPNKLQ